VRKILGSRHLLYSLARREYQLRYRQSFAGLGWAIIIPLITLVVGNILFHQTFKVDTGGVNYAVFTLAGLVPWSFFSGSLTTGSGSIVTNRQLVTKLPFPRAVLPLADISTSLIDMGVALVLFVVVAMILGSGLPLTALWLPLLLLIEVVFVVGIVFFITSLNVFARDIRLGVPIVVQLWLFLTPVMYPLSKIPPDLRRLFRLNPMTGIVESFRDVLVVGEAPNWNLLTPAIIGAVVMLAVGIWYFRDTEPRFADLA
jgi:lipopolysaccharide transport system permease protein